MKNGIEAQASGLPPVGTRIEFTKTVAESDVYLYAGITGDFSPNHIDERYMGGGRYKRRIAHGALMVGFMSAAASRLSLGRTVSVGYDAVRFTAPVYFGDTITTEYMLREVDAQKGRMKSDVCCINQDGVVVARAVHLRALVD